MLFNTVSTIRHVFEVGLYVYLSDKDENVRNLFDNSRYFLKINFNIVSLSTYIHYY